MKTGLIVTAIAAPLLTLIPLRQDAPPSEGGATRSFFIPRTTGLKQDAAAGADGTHGGVRHPTTLLATMYANDPITSSLSLSDGVEGGSLHDNKCWTSSNEIVFGDYFPDDFAIGYEGGSLGVIVDLGTRESLKEKYGYTETVGHFQGFASIHRKDGSFVILKDYEGQTTQALIGAAALFDGSAEDHARVHMGHVYLVRINRGDANNELLAKLIVVNHVPEVLATIRWQLLD